MSMMQKLKDFTKECVRVLRITKRPDKEELLTIIKVSGLGILAIGFIGFIFHMLNQLLISRALG
ncbi:protein translocase SEC61 complex subunit gamma [Candidatus Woesearchaeota archaeon]|nr:protein translocase SEC61 complex subunit gamma [Candidatus Woesearchaeota archaeon]